MVTQSLKSDDRVGKVFLCISADERRCLVCLQVFSRLDSLEHSRGICLPWLRQKWFQLLLREKITGVPCLAV